VIFRRTARVEIRVSDSGHGLLKSQQESIFIPYDEHDHNDDMSGEGSCVFRGRGAGSHKQSSSGLGLYISRGIARQMGGDLTASSDGLGKGSTFTFEFLCEIERDPTALLDIDSDSGLDG